MCEIIEGIFYVLRSGCPWLLLRDSFPPWRAVYRCFSELRDGGSLKASTIIWPGAIGNALAWTSPSAVVIKSQSVKTLGGRHLHPHRDSSKDLPTR